MRWWRSGPPRLRLRRRLLVFSAPIALAVVVVIAKSVSVAVAGNAAVSAFADRDADAMRAPVATLHMLNVAEPAKAYFAGGTLAVLDNRLEEADRQFAESLARTDPAASCPVRVNLELVRETLGDRAFAVFKNEAAVARYLSARRIVEEAPPGCFAGNADPDPQRRAVRDDAAARLDGKINAAKIAPPPPPPPPQTAAAPQPPPPAASGTPSADPDAELRLDPGGGDPLDKLQQILRDAAARAGG